MDDYNKAIELFLSNTSYKESDIRKIKEIHLGYTNKSFLFIMTDKEKYQVRLAKNNDIVNRDVEKEIMPYLKNNVFVYHDGQGNAIKKWIFGYNPKFIFNKKKLLSKLVEAIVELHKTDISKIKIIKHDYYEYSNPKIESELFPLNTKYQELVEKYKNLKLVLSHNDINPLNMIYDWKNKRIVLIDYEWARINYQYFDLANFLRETNFKYKWIKYCCLLYPNFDLKILLDFCFICSYFAHLWSFQIDQTPKIIKYRKRNLKRLNYFYSLISKYKIN